MLTLLALVAAAGPDAGTSAAAESLRACVKSTVKADAACAVRSGDGLQWVESSSTSRETVIDSARAFLNEQAGAWNRGELETFTASYADDATFISPTGVTRGRDQVLARYKKRYPDKAAMGTLSFEFLDTRVSAGAVSITAKWNLSYPNKPPATGHTLVVLHPRASSWMVVQDASM